MAIDKLPGGLEDLLFGMSASQQVRKGVVYHITEINASHIPYSISVTVAQELERLDSVDRAMRTDLANKEPFLGYPAADDYVLSSTVGGTRSWSPKESGPTGPEGPQGEQGETGPQGPKGDEGDVGPGFNFQGSITVEDLNLMTGFEVGDGWVMLNPGTVTVGSQPVDVIIDDLVVWGEEGYFANFGTVKGVQGDKGDTGDTGAQGPTGPQGVKGDTGPAGPKGDQGLQGIQGPTGPQGVKGDTGLTGDEGPQGIQGPIGLTGDTGLTGDEGPIGPIGLEGPEGPIGLTGDEGPQGPQGIAGTGINILGSDTVVNILAKVVVAIGDSWIATDTGTDSAGTPVAINEVLRATTVGAGAFFVNIGEIKGEKGDTGLQGPIGDTGPQGIQGEIGPIGLDGPQGPIGVTGDTGLQGPIGLDGPQGLPGDTGAQGPIGLDGPKGDTGLDGPTGPVGPDGPDGIQGPQGIQGPGFTFHGDATVAQVNLFDPVSLVEGDGWVMLDSGTITVGLVPLAVVINECISWNTAGSFSNLGDVQGPQGIQGVDGPTGADGPEGPQGIQAPVIDNLTTTDPASALSANMGSTLNININNHVANVANPHAVTKAQVGLSNVDNTSDASKPVSDPTQAEINKGTTPIGGIIMYNGAIANIPSNWALCDGLNGTIDMLYRIPRGTDIEADIGTQGGSNDTPVISHYHTGPDHNHSVDHDHSATTSATGDHIHDLMTEPCEVGGGGGMALRYDGNLVTPTAEMMDAGSHNHTLTTDWKTMNTSGGGTGNTSTVGGDGANANLPPWTKVLFIQRIS